MTSTAIARARWQAVPPLTPHAARRTRLWLAGRGGPSGLALTLLFTCGPGFPVAPRGLRPQGAPHRGSAPLALAPLAVTPSPKGARPPWGTPWAGAPAPSLPGSRMAGTRAVPLNAPLGMGPPAVVAARLARARPSARGRDGPLRARASPAQFWGGGRPRSLSPAAEPDWRKVGFAQGRRKGGLRPPSEFSSWRAWPSRSGRAWRRRPGPRPRVPPGSSGPGSPPPA